MRIRETVEKDLVFVDAIFNSARDFMRLNGNPHQWNQNYPTSRDVAQDIKSKRAFVCVNDDDIPIGTFVLFDYEPAYDYIEGAWLSDKPYKAVHRIATVRKGKIGSFIIKFLEEKYEHLRIDTHENNVPMQNLLTKFNFKRCGIIYIPDHGQRVAFEFVK